MSSWDEMKKAKEESYFDRRNREAIERLQKKQEAEKPRPSPITGEPMKQEVLHGVVIDRCPTSGGVWLDAGELEQLLQVTSKGQDDKDSTLLGFFRDLAGTSKKR